MNRFWTHAVSSMFDVRILWLTLTLHSHLVPAYEHSTTNAAKLTPLDDGSMQKDKREASLEKIRSSKTTRCILISFKAGSTGEFYGRLRFIFKFPPSPWCGSLPGQGSCTKPWLVFPRSRFRRFFGNFLFSYSHFLPP